MIDGVYFIFSCLERIKTRKYSYGKNYNSSAVAVIGRRYSLFMVSANSGAANPQNGHPQLADLEVA
ncbi:hypothetical protein [Methylobacter sp.]|uniref:hypothetical protein n=1 Tax=Methylobacter sp. TaxID=2051955 RepID=UPI001206D0BE|nr:hypothetical protein [Methylobacter sp.]TAK63396.1 MAG: hypothetical protein EPO18_07265 [Methylobacter sp.]